MRSFAPRLPSTPTPLWPVCSAHKDAGAPASPTLHNSGGSSGSAGVLLQRASERRGWKSQLQWLYWGQGAFIVGLFLSLLPAVAVAGLAIKLAQDVLLTMLVGLLELAPELKSTLLEAVAPDPDAFVSALSAGLRALSVAALCLLSAQVVRALRRLARRGGRCWYGASALTAGYLCNIVVGAIVITLPDMVDAPPKLLVCYKVCRIAAGLLFLAWWRNRLLTAGEEVHRLFAWCSLPSVSTWECVFMGLLMCAPLCI